MACPKCGCQLSDDMKFCPKCGSEIKKEEVNNIGETQQADIPTPETKSSVILPVPSQNAAKEFTKKKNKMNYAVICVIIIGIILIYPLFVNRNSQSAEKSQNAGVSNNTIIQCAEKEISDSLRAPSQARWYDTEILDHDRYGRYLVHLEVDAMNGFGGYERQNYLVVVFDVQPDGHFTVYPNQAAYQLSGSTYTQTSVDAEKENNFWGKPIESSSES